MSRKRITHDQARELVSAILEWPGARVRPLAKLGDYINQQESADCRMGVPCQKHSGITHGLEAETLRKGIEKLIGDSSVEHSDETLRQLQELLDNTNAGDSLAYLERKGKRRPKAAKKVRKRGK